MFHITIISAPFAVIQTNCKSYITNIPTITDFQSLLSQTAVKSEGGRLLLPPRNINMHKNTLASTAVLCGWLANTVSDPGKGEIFPVRTTKVYRKIRSIAQSFLTSAPDGGEWSTSCLGHFTPTNEPHYPLSRRPGGPRAGLNIFVKRNLAETGL